MSGKVKLAVALGALVALAAVAAFGDNNVLDKSTYYQNATNGAKTDANGNAYTNEASKDRDNFQIVNVCDDTMSVAQFIDANSTAGFQFTAESSAVITSYPYRRFTLMMRVIPVAADTTSRFRFAVQVRKHTDATGDSSSTFAWASWANATAMSAASDDSTGHFTAATFFSGGASTGAGAWSDERVFVLTAERGNAIGVAGSTQQSFGWPGGIAVDLCDARGQWFWAPYMSVRIRCLSAGAAASKPRVIAKLAMGS